jgi:DNA-binding CsgD family transcriptional regulator
MTNIAKIPVGVTYGQLTVLGDSGKRSANRNVFWLCSCTCGNTKIIEASSVRRGLVVSCGCFRKKQTREALYNGTRKLTPAQKDELVLSYQDGTSGQELARLYDIDPSSVLSLLRTRGIPRRIRAEAGRYIPLRQDAFTQKTPQANYWAGFLAADGNVFLHTLQIGIHNKDECHLRKLRSFLQSEHKIIRSRQLVRLSVNSKTIVHDLEDYGIYPNKSHTYSPPSFLQYDKDFWRGMIDGDGCIGLYKRSSGTYLARLELCGSYDCVALFTKTLRTLFGLNVSTRKMKTIYRVSCGGRSAFQVVKWLYEGAECALQRKAAVAQQILNPPHDNGARGILLRALAATPSRS